MAVIDTITIGSLRILVSDSDPTTGGGIAAPIGSLVVDNTTGLLYTKTNTSDTDYSSAGGISSSDITGLTTVTAATGDLVLIADVSNANALKNVTAQSIADLASSSSITASKAIAYAIALG